MNYIIGDLTKTIYSIDEVTTSISLAQFKL